MDTLALLLLGLLVGGIVNALADDLPTGRRPRLPKYRNGQRRPLLAWLGISAFAFRLRDPPEKATGVLADGTRDRRNLSWRYPLVEVVSAALMALTFAVARDTTEMSCEETLIWLAFVALFILIAVIDLEHKRIPVEPLIASVLLALVRALAFPLSSPTAASMLAGALSANLTFTLVYVGGLIFVRMAKRYRPNLAVVTGFGRGDVYLMSVGGLIVGFPDVLVAMTMTILLGGIGALAFFVVKTASGGYRRFSALPYAPNILTSIYAVMLLGDELNRLIFGL